MNTLPITESALVVRTDFSNPAAWDAICAIIRTPVDGFEAFVEFIDDPQFSTLTPSNLLNLIPPDFPHTFIILVDTQAMTSPDHPLLIVDLFEQPGRSFRALPRTIQSIENNLSIANMGFEDFSESVDSSGIFRGF